MDVLWCWLERLRGVLFRSRVEREIEAEMRLHLEMETEALIASGLDPATARRQARLGFGTVEAHRARAREERWGHALGVVVQDTHYAVRLLRKTPVLAVSALATLALGIGGSAAVLGIVQGVLLAPLPYDAAERVVWIQTRWAGAPDARISPAEFLDYEAELDAVFSHLGVYAPSTATLTGDGEAVAVPAAWLSWQTFSALGVQPILGRTFTAEEDRSGAPVILVSEGVWQQRFAGAEDVLGRELVVDARAREIIGVLPASFRLPDRLLAGEPEKLFGPHGIDPAQVTDRGSHYLYGVARRRPGISLGEAAGALEMLATDFRRRYPADYPEEEAFTATAVALARHIRGPVTLPIAVLAGAVGLVLAITCINVAGLLLARLDRRRHELALRASLGAGRRRIGAQMLVESLVLTLAGGALGIGVGQALLGLLLADLPAGLGWLSAARIDLRVIAGAVLLSALTGLAVGLAPARHAARQALIPALRPAGRGSAGRGDRRLRRALSVLQLALALVLLVVAGLLLRSFDALLRVDPGFRAEGAVAASLALPAAAYPENGDVVGFFRSLEPMLAAIPGVQAAGFVTNLPLASGLGDMDFEIAGRPLAAGAVEPVADWQVVSPGYFASIGLQLVAGRPILATDGAENAGVLVVSETFARTYFPGEQALGRRLRLLGDGTAPAIAEIVGIVADVRHRSLAEAQRAQMYFAHEQFRFWGSRRAAARMTLVAASAQPADALRPAIESAVRRLDPGLPLLAYRSLEEVRRASVAVPRLLTQALGGFALVALVLAAIGIYGVMAQLVAQRIPELGIRLALGARRSAVAWMVIREGLLLTLAGLAVGSALALMLAGGLERVLYGVAANDLPTFAAVTSLLAISAVLACSLPARRATRVDPARLLRAP